MNIKEVTLGRIAVAGLLFDSLTPYNVSLAAFRSAISGKLDLFTEEHGRVMLKWLNDWGCRHLSKGQHQIASKSISDWYQNNRTTLFNDEAPIWQLQDQEINIAADAYASLKDSIGAKHYRQGNKLEAHIGPTAASKVLFALRPKALMPWDEAMRKYFGYTGSPRSYFEYLIEIRDLTAHIGYLCESKGFHIDDFPEKVGRADSTVVELLNEYIWIRTRKIPIKLPAPETLVQWASLG
jgi:hypothetical protein